MALRLRYPKLADESPYQKFGMCCGSRCRKEEKLGDQILYRVREYVYRCRRCFRKEAGYYP